MRIVQVSDVHLSRKRAYFQDNWEVFLDEMRSEPPDRIYITGDLCINGPNEPDDVAFAREQMDRLPVAWKAIPGNHDAGEVPPDTRLGKPLSTERRQHWIDHFGPDWWVDDVGAWRFIGLNTQLLDSQLPEEDEQWAFLQSALTESTPLSIGLYLHKPLFLRSPDENDQQLSALFPSARRRLLALIDRHRIRFVGSGHQHCFRSMRYQRARLVWAPATSFINTAKARTFPRAVWRAGYVEYHFGSARFDVLFKEPALFVSHDYRNWFQAKGSTVYLPLRPLAQTHPLANAK
jgi:3',5'-cyclic AMP phosphodiesterase CpdA